MSGQIIGPIGVLPTAASGPLTFTATDVATAWQIGGNSPYTFSSNIGTASSDRVVVACIYLDASASDVTAVTINGVTATSIVSYANVNNAAQSIYAALVTSGSGAQNIVITTVNAFPGGVGVMVGTVTGSATTTAGPTANVPMATSNDPHAISASIPANGVAVIAMLGDGGGSVTPSWTGATQDGTIVEGGGNTKPAFLAHGTTNSVSFTGANSPRQTGMLMATWGP